MSSVCSAYRAVCSILHRSTSSGGMGSYLIRCTVRRGKKRCSVPRRASDVTRFSSPSNSITLFTMIRHPHYTNTTDERTSRFRWTTIEQTSSTTHTSRTIRSIESTLLGRASKRDRRSTMPSFARVSCEFTTHHRLALTFSSFTCSMTTYSRLTSC